MRHPLLTSWWLLPLAALAWGVWPACATPAYANRAGQIPPWSPLQEISTGTAQVLVRNRQAAEGAVRYEVVVKDLLAGRPTGRGVVLAVEERPGESWRAQVTEADLAALPTGQGHPLQVLMPGAPVTALTTTRDYPDQVLIEHLAARGDHVVLDLAWRRADGGVHRGQLTVIPDAEHRRFWARVGQGVVSIPVYAVCIAVDAVIIAVSIPVVIIVGTAITVAD